jgi:hypothetical protein
MLRRFTCKYRRWKRAWNQSSNEKQRDADLRTGNNCLRESFVEVDDDFLDLSFQAIA